MSNIDIGADERKTEKKVRKINIKYLILVLLVLASAGSAVYFWNDAREAKLQTPEGVQARNEQETQSVVDSLKQQLIIEGEDKPTVARVENPEVLIKANAEFYKNVQKGDYLVLYPQRAIIFRLEEKKIVNIAPIINTSDIQATEETAPDTTKTDNTKNQ